MVAHDRVHICTRSYTTQYIYVPSRIRLSTYMYCVVYDWVHICTVSYTTGYINVLCRIRPGTYMYSVYTGRYMYVPTRSTYGEVDPFCITKWWKTDLSWYLGQGEGQTWVHMLLFTNCVCVYILVIMLSDILLCLQVVSKECQVLTDIVRVRESVL